MLPGFAHYDTDCTICTLAVLWAAYGHRDIARHYILAAVNLRLKKIEGKLTARLLDNEGYW
ncbi:Hypothetical predicted protein [Pelobates cultripes]|uniref:Uncharacterized protein n=1 Tax=Pelobates cultripes TaxID=61616 RepID=A0AAD1W7M0_PELCU|nr:Hypothetical predicted protein [Pelobates cultripes]